MKFNKSAMNSNAKAVGMAALKAAIFTAAVFASGVVMAADGGDMYAGADTKVCGFLGKTNNILNMASVVVVTIAVVFAGYQIAFAHKRVSEVAPVLMGGVLIGAAGQLAKMLIGDTGQTECKATAAIQMIQHVLHYA
ncbi:TrbC/VirB2 family protein [Xanthomonas graminis]|uniref:Type IV secretion system protein Virb2 n=2 Tax=Xanthomonas graminis TaxID=3390026 RepID=A0A0K2ZFE1_9XANT|nr:TrbC/VirB2 family protein [Xanthomonas translucens]UKE60836.1 TrbC/VirB2 family protein [Xanthomonas translucens pv. poae]UKE67143.1 TrbC/VirB2 family protein [Xanthomonas translucens pv. phlei]CTP83758.1 type IV secretion system protein Virb2 [Xanthomonas translucens pv. phlei]CTP84323.1 type IV secretion system protein Virb2 [Xanthomonas translucens pv. poae]